MKPGIIIPCSCSREGRQAEAQAMMETIMNEDQHMNRREKSEFKYWIDKTKEELNKIKAKANIL